MINKLFKSSCGGSDPEESLLLLYNGIKENFFLPEYMMLENITTAYKNKGSRFDMDNDNKLSLQTKFHPKKLLRKLLQTT